MLCGLVVFFFTHCMMMKRFHCINRTNSQTIKKYTQMIQTISSLFIWFTLSAGNSNTLSYVEKNITKKKFSLKLNPFMCWVCAKSIMNTMIHWRKFVHVFWDHPLSLTLNLVHRSTDFGFYLCLVYLFHYNSLCSLSSNCFYFFIFEGKTDF